MRSLRRLLLTAAVVSATALAYTSVASANQFGLRIWSPSQEYGDISSIDSPTAAQQPPKADAMYLHRVVMQNDPGTALIQAGWVTTGSGVELDNCGSLDSATADFVETEAVGGGYTCYQYTTWTGNTDWNFNVYVNSTGWNVKIDGDVDPDGPWHLGMATGQVQVGGESWTGSGAGKAAACYGKGASAWDYYPAQTQGGSGSIVVSPNADTTTHVTGEWSIGAAPTPFCDNLG